MTRGGGWGAAGVMTAACLTLGWFLYVVGIDPGAATTDGKSDAVRPGPVALPAQPTHAVPPKAAYEAIVARPLFAANRRPVTAGDADTPAAPFPDAGLVGIVIGPAKAVALMRDRQTGQVRRLRHGDRYDGWRVETIDGTAVVFARGDTRRRLALDFAEPPAR